jgi:hypothetical protein
MEMIPTKNQKIVVPCDACGKIVSTYGNIRLSTNHPTHKYTTSNKKFIMNYKWRLCAKDFDRSLKAIQDSIQKL